MRVMLMIFYQSSGNYLQRPAGKSSSVSLLTTCANDPTLARLQPIQPAKLYDSLAHFKLDNPIIDDINLGLSPFMMCPSGYYKADSQMWTNALYTSLHPDGGTASLADLQTLLVSSFNLPSVCEILQHYGGCSPWYGLTIGNSCTCP
jgi:hypothetical protein